MFKIKVVSFLNFSDFAAVLECGAFASCIKEEIYNVSGVRSDPIGDASLFSNDNWNALNLGSPVFRPLHHLDLWVMRMLYDDLIEDGDSISQTRVNAVEILTRDCG